MMNVGLPLSGFNGDKVIAYKMLISSIIDFPLIG